MASRLTSGLLVAWVCGLGCISSSYAVVDLGNSLAAGGELTYRGGALGNMNYRVFLPDGYDGTKTYPVVLYLHSAAERGDTTNEIFNIMNLNGDGKIADNPWIKPLIQETQHGEHKAILITPEGGAWQVWNSYNSGDSWNQDNYTNANAPAESNNIKKAMAIVNLVSSTKKVDTNRVYVTGPSMGGWGTWDILARYPEKFAAGAPLSGGGNLTAASTVLKNKPIWAFHGAGDTLITPIHSGSLINAMNAADGSLSNGNPIMSYVSGVGHGGWDTFYTPDTYHTSSPTTLGGAGLDFYDWMFSKSLATPEPTSLGLLAVGALALLRRKSCH